MKLGKPIKFVALKPEEVVERVKKNLVKDAKEKTQRLDTLKGDEVLEELTSLFTKGVKFVEPSDLSGSLKGRQNLYNHLDMMIRDAEKTITIVRIAAPIDNNNIKVAKDFAKVAEVRNMEKMKARFVVIDSTQLMFMLLNDEKFHPNYDLGVWINTEFFAQALEQLFELAWKQMKPIK